MIQYDDKQGTHFIGKAITVTLHAKDQAVEDFRIASYDAERWIIDTLVKSQFIGMVYGDNGQPVRLFGYQRIAFILAEQTDVVITVYARHKVDAALRNPLEEIVRTTVRTANERLATVEASTKKSIASLRGLRREAERNECDSMLSKIDSAIKVHERDLHDARQEHARLLKGVVAYV